ncbi:hypothetical protein HPP92_003866 [Vanilla planifolia]|uniref:Uncharacterized protein n=1 Tax=Vanilla planifolia TaxID=51239 RepID=A0A835S403_VANPL|nr:hypothetical protein HPP92_003866 [Vanilla planifolia]
MLEATPYASASTSASASVEEHAGHIASSISVPDRLLTPWLFFCPFSHSNAILSVPAAPSSRITTCVCSAVSTTNHGSLRGLSCTKRLTRSLCRPKSVPVITRRDRPVSVEGEVGRTGRHREGVVRMGMKYLNFYVHSHLLLGWHVL